MSLAKSFIVGDIFSRSCWAVKRAWSFSRFGLQPVYRRSTRNRAVTPNSSAEFAESSRFSSVQADLLT
jgi:hypothetical protein